MGQERLLFKNPQNQEWQLHRQPFQKMHSKQEYLVVCNSGSQVTSSEVVLFQLDFWQQTVISIMFASIQCSCEWFLDLLLAKCSLWREVLGHRKPSKKASWHDCESEHTWLVNSSALWMTGTSSSTYAFQADPLGQGKHNLWITRIVRTTTFLNFESFEQVFAPPLQMDPGVHSWARFVRNNMYVEIWWNM